MNDNRFPFFLALVRCQGSFCWQGFVIPARRILGFAIPLLLLTACDPGRHERMQQELAALQAMNQADSLLTNDSLAQALADWFDAHGTPNEQMEAHYLLGRTHADRGEAPAALAAYHDAADRAGVGGDLNGVGGDLKSPPTDCNYRLLCRVYAQMADIFYRQNLMEENIKSLDKSVYYAQMAKDTMVAINSYAHKMSAYERLGLHDSVSIICDNIQSQYFNSSYRQTVICFFSQAISSYIHLGRIAEAKEMLDYYERESGYFDDNMVIEPGREAYYDLKGKYYLAVNNLDSVEVCYRLEMLKGRDYVNQNMAARGLSRIFQARNMADSALKYSVYSYDMNDSLYDRMATQEVEQVKGMYDYSRFQDYAIKEEEKANYFIKMTYSMIFGIIVIIIAASLYWYQLVKKRKAEKAKYLGNLRRLNTARMELQEIKVQVSYLEKLSDESSATIDHQVGEMSELKLRVSELSKIVQLKETEIKYLRSELDIYNATRKEQNVETEMSRILLEESDVFKRLHKKIHPLNDDEWQELYHLTHEVLNDFGKVILVNNNSLTEKEKNLCVLFRLYVKPKSAGNLLGVSPSAITKMSKAILQKIYGEEGSAKTLSEKLLQII